MPLRNRPSILVEYLHALRSDTALPLTAPTPSVRSSGRRYLAPCLGAIFGVALIQFGTPSLRADDSGETVSLPQFTISAARDKGYQANDSVSGSRIDTLIKDLPFTVDAFTPQFIEDIGAVDLTDIVAYSPGVSQATRGQVAGDCVYTIRGFQNAPQVNGFVSPNSIGQTNTSGPDVDAVAIERVEVVKGPASLLYGQVNPGGTVNYLTKVAQDAPFASIGVEGGSFDFWRTTADINQPLIPGTLLFRVNFAYENDFQWIQPYKGRTTVIVPTLTWKVSDRLSLKLDYSELHRLEAPMPNTPPTINIVAPPGANGRLGSTGALQNTNNLSNPGLVGFYPFPLSYNDNSTNDWRYTNLQTFSAELDYKIGDRWVGRINASRDITYVAFKSTGLQSGSVTVDVPASYTAQYPTYAQAAQAFASAILQNPSVVLQAPNQQLSRNEYLREAPAQETAIQGEVTGKVDLGWVKLAPLFGAYYDGGWSMDRRHQSGVNGTYTPFTVPSAANAVTAPPPWDFADLAQFPIDNGTNFDPSTLPYANTFTQTFAHDRAAYASTSARLLDDRLLVVAGIRYNESDQRIVNYLTNPLANNPSSPTWTPLYRETKPTYQLASGYKVTPNVMLYASYSESYFAVADLPNTLGPLPAKPETGRGYEAGIKLDLDEGRVSSTICVYQIDQFDRPIGVSYVNAANQNISTNFQGTEDRSRGVEGQITYSPTDNWQVLASISEDDFRLIKAPSLLSYYLGTAPQDVPKIEANLWTRYSFRGGPLVGLWAGGGVNCTGKKAGFITNPVYKLPAVEVFHLAAGYDWRFGKTPMSMRLNWDNVGRGAYYATVQAVGLPSRVTLSLKATY